MPSGDPPGDLLRRHRQSLGPFHDIDTPSPPLRLLLKHGPAHLRRCDVTEKAARYLFGVSAEQVRRPVREVVPTGENSNR
jgi:hypothetical protein